MVLVLVGGGDGCKGMEEVVGIGVGVGDGDGGSGGGDGAEILQDTP